ncbi:MAG: hypothetical protein M1826_001583 [Phylliscum demangeonii]|nr:MAG: hypothetical protein M1826_001583 [Phylliscum demangeonii]
MLPALRTRFAVLLRPPTGGIWTLGLDGGGVKGIVAIEAMRCLERHVALAIPWYEFFDLMGGSSIGGIIAHELGLRRSSLDECFARSCNLVRLAFDRSTSKYAVIPWFQSVSNVWRVLVYDGMYSATAALKQTSRDAVRFGAGDVQ